MRLTWNNDVKRSLGNTFLTLAAATFVFVSVDSQVDISKSINDDDVVWYELLCAVQSLIGVFLLASIETSSTERYGIRMVQMTHPVHVKVDGRSPLPPIVEEQQTKTKTEKKKKDKRKRN